MDASKELTWVLDKARDFGDVKIFEGRLPFRMVRKIRGFIHGDNGVVIVSSSFGKMVAEIEDREVWLTLSDHGTSRVEFWA